MWKFIVICSLLLTFTGSVVTADQHTEKSVEINQKVKEWQLKDTEEKNRSLKKLSKDKKAVVLIFLATQCPVVDDYVDRIVALLKDYTEKDVQFVGIHSNKHETLEEIAKYRKEHKLEFPILKDPKNKIADYFTARRTPEVFLLDKERILRYRGAIDDSRHTPDTPYLRKALDLILAEKPIPDKLKKTRAIGCTIKRVRKASLDRTP